MRSLAGTLTKKWSLPFVLFHMGYLCRMSSIKICMWSETPGQGCSFDEPTAQKLLVWQKAAPWCPVMSGDRVLRTWCQRVVVWNVEEICLRRIFSSYRAREEVLHELQGNFHAHCSKVFEHWWQSLQLCPKPAAVSIKSMTPTFW